MASVKANFIDLKHGKNFSYEVGKFGDFKIKDKKSKIVARTKYNDLFIHNFKLEKISTNAELLVTSELKMYDEIGLDPTKVHKIGFITKEATLDGITLVESYAIDSENFKSSHTKALEDAGAKHIDFLVLPLLSFETLYTNDIITKNNDLFIVIEEDEAFGLFYKDGHYISSKKIFSLSDMVKDLETHKISMTVKKLKETLIDKGLERGKYEMMEFELYEYISTTFSNFLSKLSSIAMHNRNVYGFSSVERVFISIDGKSINALDEQLKINFPDSNILSLNFFDEQLNLLDMLAASYACDKYSEDDMSHNFSMYERKLPFFKSEVGKLSISSIAAILIMSSYPVYLQYNIESLSLDNQDLQTRLSEVSRASSKLKKEDKKIQSEIKIQKKKLEQTTAKFQKLRALASELLSLKSRDSQYTPMLLTINNLLKKYKLSLSNIEQKGKGILDLEIYSTSKQRDNLAKFMQNLLEKGYKSSSNEITQDKGIYKSIIRIEK
jgi:hypothetical protein